MFAQANVQTSRSFFIFMSLVPPPGRSGQNRNVSRLVFLAVFLFLALLVLFQEFPLLVDLDAPFLAAFIHNGFVDGFALFLLLLDPRDLAGASFIF
jgi:hypothetical protein